MTARVPDIICVAQIEYNEIYRLQRSEIMAAEFTFVHTTHAVIVCLQIKLAFMQTQNISNRAK